MAFLKLINVQGLAGIAVGLALSILLGLQVIKTHDARKDATAAHALYQGELVAHQQTVINYQQAAEKARQADAANVARVQAEQSAINEKAKNDYEARLADARARADSLRSQLNAAAHPGSPGTAPVSDPGSASGRTDAATPQDGFSVSDRLIATEQAIQLDELIKWLQKNLTVDYGNSSKPLPTGNR